MKITELFDSGSSFKVTMANDENYKAKFTIEDKEYLVICEFDEDDGWLVEFSLDGETEATGTGDEFKVFATMKNILADFIKQMKPEKFSFSASDDEESRKRLYKRMSKQIASQLKFDVEERHEPGETFFTFTK